MLRVHGSYSSLDGPGLSGDRLALQLRDPARLPSAASAANLLKLSGGGLLLSDEAIDAGDHHLGLAVDQLAL